MAATHVRFKSMYNPPVILDLCLICGKVGWGNRKIIVTSSFFQNLSVHAETHCRLFQIPPVMRTFLKSFVFVPD